MKSKNVVSATVRLDSGAIVRQGQCANAWESQHPKLTLPHWAACASRPHVLLRMHQENNANDSRHSQPAQDTAFADPQADDVEHFGSHAYDPERLDDTQLGCLFSPRNSCS